MARCVAGDEADHFPRIDDAYIRNGKKSRMRSESHMDAKTDDNTAGKCPVVHTTARVNRDWWPNQLNLQVLHQHSTLSDPMGDAFDYAKEFKSLDLNAVIKDLHALMP